MNRGWTLEEVEANTRISDRFLRAMEDDDFRSLPGNFFAKSFLRQYSSALGLYDQEFEAEIRNLLGAHDEALPGQQTARPEVPVEPILEAFNSEIRQDRNLLLPIGLFIAALAGATLLYVNFEDRDTGVAAFDTPPSMATEIAGEPQAPPAPTGGEPAAGEPAAQDMPAPAPPGEADAPEVPSAAPPVATAPEPGPSDSPPGAAAPISLVIAASEDVWIDATADGRRTFAGTLRAGEVRTVQGVEVARVVIGNAGGVSITWNGKTVEDVGPRGQVRILRFTPTGFAFVPRDPQPATSAPST